MQKPYTVRLAAAQYTTTGDKVVYTTPTGFTTVLRHAIIYNNDAGSATMDLYVALVSPSGNVHIYRALVTATSSVLLDMRQVLLPGDVVHLSVGGSGGGVMLTGYQFTS